ncbi:hypothetical protein FBZ93_111160 [Bradyrhizobium macuxiense]|uniref:Uncharacterized protein n=1 Tax=Bradyrhizobium macuxiense TaxID=1755647 RepID=A0A560LC20_9BRAD|nr:hypothetical protein [Bradyrhizobium macuxiense]TWB93121.1 hypothetical protein FBZ93_111160 [Bradyrhizobium macuxiense]
MIDIRGLLSRLFEMQQLVQAGEWYRNVVSKTQMAPLSESRNNVIYVDFKAIREAKEGKCVRRS